MAKPKPEDIQKEIDEQEDEVYGTGYVDADPEKFTDTEDMLEDVIGNPPVQDEEQEEEEGFSIAEEVNKDEHEIAEDKPEDKVEDEIEKEEENLEKEEEYVKSHPKKD